MIVEILNAGRVIWLSSALWLSQNTLMLEEDGTDRAPALDDTYVGMEIRIDGNDAGCVDDYVASTRTITYGYCERRRGRMLRP